VLAAGESITVEGQMRRVYDGAMKIRNAVGLLMLSLGVSGCGAAADCPCAEPGTANEANETSAPVDGARVRIVVLEAGDLDLPDECGESVDPWRSASSLPARVELHYGDSGQRVRVASNTWVDVADGPVDISASLRSDLLYVLDPARPSTSATLARGAEETVELTLPRRFVRIVSGDADADHELNPKLVVDGDRTTPLAPLFPNCAYYPLSVGDHEVEVDATGGGTVGRQIHVAAEGPREIVVDTSR